MPLLDDGSLEFHIKRVPRVPGSCRGWFVAAARRTDAAGPYPVSACHTTFRVILPDVSHFMNQEIANGAADVRHEASGGLVRCQVRTGRVAYIDLIKQLLG